MSRLGLGEFVLLASELFLGIFIFGLLFVKEVMIKCSSCLVDERTENYEWKFLGVGRQLCSVHYYDATRYRIKMFYSFFVFYSTTLL